MIKMMYKFATFFVILVVFVLAFALLFQQRFGGKIEGYDGMIESFFSSFFLLIGDFEVAPFSAMFTRADQLEWKFAVLVHLCIGNILLLNLLIAVLSTWNKTDETDDHG